MYYCNDCSSVFEECDIKRGQQLEHFGTPCHETFAVCPFCGGEDFEDAVQCVKCGEWTRETDCDIDNVCPSCVKDINKRFNEVFSAIEREVIFAGA